MNDGSIISMDGVNSRNPRDLALVFEKYYNRLQSLGNTITKDRSVTEDIICDVFANLLQNKNNQFINEKALLGFLRKAVKNTSLNHLRNWNRRTEIRHEMAFIDQPADDSPLQRMIRTEMVNAFDEIVETLPEKCRAVFKLLHIEEKTAAEVADQLGIRIHTVYNHDRRAMAHLRKKIDRKKWYALYMPVLLYMFF